jgi:hypothetical protein
MLVHVSIFSSDATTRASLRDLLGQQVQQLCKRDLLQLGHDRLGLTLTTLAALVSTYLA